MSNKTEDEVRDIDIQLAIMKVIEVAIHNWKPDGTFKTLVKVIVNLPTGLAQALSKEFEIKRRDDVQR